MRVRIGDVAESAGVSKATVSLALNGSPLVNQKTAMRIREIAGELGYCPDPYARRLVLGRSGMLGLVVPDIENVYYASFVRHVNQAIRSTDYGLSIAISDSSRQAEARIVREMIQNQVEALILAPVNKQNEDLSYLEDLEKAKIPVVFATSRYPGAKGPCVMCDLADGMRTLVGHLCMQGIARMVLMTGPEGAYALETRERAFRETLRYCGLSGGCVERAEEVSYAGAYQKVMDMNPNTFDALICVNDMMALGALNALSTKGVRVPEEKAVAGFDDVIFSNISPVPLTTVRQDIDGMAREATTLARKLIDPEKVQSSDRILPCELIIRESTKVKRGRQPISTE